MAPGGKREKAWARLARDLDFASLHAITRIEPLSKLPQLADAIVEWSNSRTRGDRCYCLSKMRPPSTGPRVYLHRAHAFRRVPTRVSDALSTSLRRLSTITPIQNRRQLAASAECAKCVACDSATRLEIKSASENTCRNSAGTHGRDEGIPWPGAWWPHLTQAVTSITTRPRI